MQTNAKIEHIGCKKRSDLMRHLLIYDMIEAVHRAGSIRKAAEDMNITASARNRRI